MRKLQQIIACTFIATGLCLNTTQVLAIDISTGIELSVTSMTKTLGGQPITFWVYCLTNATGPGSCADPQLPGPLLELGVGAAASVTLALPMGGGMMTMPMEPMPYNGHTIHFHGLDLPQSEDGVPDTGAAVMGDTYTFNVDSRYVGAHKYHCHVHTVKHLEMGMYGPFIVRAVDTAGNFINTINEGGPAYDAELTLLLSTVDPTYHTSTAIGDGAVFADYNPQFFLINGNEGSDKTTPADSLTTTVSTTVAIRLIGLHSVNATFQLLDAADVTQEFVLHNMDGFALNTPKTLTEIEISPGQTRDILVTLPATAGTVYPQITYRKLKDDTAYATVFTAIDFN